MKRGILDEFQTCYHLRNMSFIHQVYGIGNHDFLDTCISIIINAKDGQQVKQESYTIKIYSAKRLYWDPVV